VDWLIPPGFNGAFLVASRIDRAGDRGLLAGFALLLAPFEFFGDSMALQCVLGRPRDPLDSPHHVRDNNDQRAAGWALLFTLASGAFIANAISYYSMQAHLTANLLFAWLLLKA